MFLTFFSLLFHFLFSLSQCRLYYALRTYELSRGAIVPTSTCQRFPIRYHETIQSVRSPFPVQDITGYNKGCGERYDFFKTDEMLEAHKEFTQVHGLEPFTANATAQAEASRWCSIQYHASCDLVYPLNIAMNAAKAPAFIPLKEIVQFWYNQRESYNPQKSFLDNLYQSQQEFHEILGYANIVAEAEDRQLGCCRVPCQDDLSMVYGCVYMPHGAGYWKIANDSAGHKGFSFFVPPQLADRTRLAIARGNHVRSVPYSQLITAGCSSHVPGNGPNTVLNPWRYPCSSLVEKNIREQMEKSSQLEEDFFFTSLSVVAGNCTLKEPTVDGPYLLYCPISCLSEALAQYKAVKRQKTVDKQMFSTHATGESLCSQASLKSSGFQTKSSMLMYMGPEESLLKDVFNTLKCASIFETFMDCGRTKQECFFRLSSTESLNPWISKDLQVQDLPPKVFILKNSFCVASSFSVQLLPLRKAFGRLSLLTSYLNPGNFISFNIDISSNLAELVCCTQSNCVRSEPALLEEVTNESLRFDLVRPSEEPKRIEGKFNGETISTMENCFDAKDIPGASGLGVSPDAEIHFIEKVQLKPIFENPLEDSLEDDVLLTNSFLPLWNLGRVDNHTRIIELMLQV